LKDDGYPTFKWIVTGRERRGRVIRNADGTFTGRIGTVEAHGQSEDDVLQQVVAEVEGLSISEIRYNILHQKKVQADTEAIIDWLKDNAVKHDGHLVFTNIDLAHAIGKQKPDRPLGQLVSRLDFACCLAGLPSLGCAAAQTFADAWKPNRRHNIVWPVERMRRRAHAHRWSAADLDRIRYETQRLASGSGRLLWDEGFAKHKARIEAWAEM
jgi:hypothetical protein